ncbi:MAG: hypothetical protein QM532_01470 [Cyanobium sp. MAG06]|nr:hypothetical protein [Cyanobium sp. MAG06]
MGVLVLTTLRVGDPSPLVPSTSNGYDGVVLPIPTLPEEFITKLLIPFLPITKSPISVAIPLVAPIFQLSEYQLNVRPDTILFTVPALAVL